MIKFVHTADTHFGVENYGKIDPKTGLHTRLLDFKSNMDLIVDSAIAQEVDLFLLCGDAYKTANPTPTQQKLLMECLFRLYKANIKIVIVVGNHDHPVSFGKAHALDVFSGLPLDGFYVFSKPGSICIQTKRGPVQIVGIPWPNRNNLMALDEYRYKDCDQIVMEISNKMVNIIKNLAKALDPSIPAILASHLTVSTGVFSGSEKRAIIGNDPMLMPSQLAIEPFNYVALGHLHRHQDLSENNAVPIVYSGSIEAVDFGEVRDKKGFCLVEIETKPNSTGGFCRKSKVNFVSLPTRKMVELEVDLGTGLEQTEQLARAIKEAGVDGAIVKISYNLKSDSVDCVDLYRIQDLLKNSIYVVSIKPVKAQVERKVRISSGDCKDLKTMLSEYFEYKGLKGRSDKLLEKAISLQEQSCQDSE